MYTKFSIKQQMSIFLKKKKKDFNKQDWYPISNSETPNTMNVHRHPPPILLFNGVSLEAHEAWGYAKRMNRNYSEGDIVEKREQTDSRRTASLKGINASG